MIWLRNFVVYLLSSLFFVVLLTTAFATSINVAFGSPTKLETWLDQSGIYGSFVDAAMKQAQSSTTDAGGSNGISLSDVAVQQAAKAAFSPTLLQKDVNTFLDANYSWLKGTVAKPSFTIDLTSAKQTFGQQVGQYVTAHLASLPVCTYAQSLNYQTIDPLLATCRPSSVNAVAEGTKLSNQITSGTGFLSTPLITETSLGGTAGTSKPYYEQYSIAPKVFQFATKLPLILGALAIVSALTIVFASPRRRKGLRKLGYTLIYAGAMLIATKFVSDMVLKNVQGKLFNDPSMVDIKNSLISFINLLESQIVKINLYFGIAFVAIAIIIFFTLIKTRDKKSKVKIEKIDTPVIDPALENTPTTDVSVSPSTTPKLPKRPRLIQ